jgi:hypothetical protein
MVMPLTSDDATDRPRPQAGWRRDRLDLVTWIEAASGPLPTLGDADKDALALVQTHDASLLERGDVHKTSLPPPSRTMKPKPLVALYHFTFPIYWPLASKGCRFNGDLKFFRGGLGGAAVLLSMLMTSVT